MSVAEEARQAKLRRVDQLHRLEAGRSALLVVDMQHGFLDEGASLEVPKGREILPNVRRLVELSRSRGVPVIFTQFVYATSIPCLRGDPFGREFRLLARTARDEFMIVLKEAGQAEHAARIARHLREEVEKPYHVASQDLRVTAHVGISVFPDDGERAEALISKASASTEEV